MRIVDAVEVDTIADASTKQFYCDTHLMYIPKVQLNILM